MDIWIIVSAVFGILATVFGAKFVSLQNALKEIADIPSTVAKALEDKNISKEELKDILTEIEEAFAAIKDIFKAQQ